jgi:hypothetical protein
MSTICYEIGAYDERGAYTLLHEAETETEARRWAEGYVAREDAGGWDNLLCNPVPFDDDIAFSWDKADGFSG